ncbi:MAG: aminoglycoside N(3)-acetyltransferase [Candidatus Thorarchaeota archaeon]
MSLEKIKQIITKSSKPITKQLLIEDLTNLGIHTGDIVIVHSSLSKLGYIVGGAVSVIDALIESVGKDGTIVMPAFTYGNTEPSNWQCPPVPKEWWDILREEIPAFDPVKMPTTSVGVIPEIFRKFPDVVRSYHPIGSFCAWGKYANEIVSVHRIDDMYGFDSPLGKLYQLGAKILLLGVDHDSNTSLHFAEWIANIPNFPKGKQSSNILQNGEKIRVTWEEISYNSEDFVELGRSYEKVVNYKPNYVGSAQSKLFLMKDLVDYAIPWFKNNRKY